MAGTLITCEIDLDAPGKATGYLRLPHSTHDSAYGFLPIPIVSLKHGTGPTVLMMAGNHGDEYEGQIAVNRLAQLLDPGALQGQLILLPAANAPAVQAGRRTSPVDDGNLNRSFPGDPAGTPTQMLAHYIEDHLLPRCDYLVDLHSGGSSLFYPPTLLRGPGYDAEEAAKLDVLQEAFDLPYAWVFTGGGGPTSTARTAMGGANRKRVVPVMAELGGGAVCDPEILALTERGLTRILASLGMLPGHTLDAPRGTRALNAQGSVYAYDAGTLELLKDIADPVEAGETVALIHDPHRPWAAPVSVTSPYPGIVLAKRALARVAPGDAVVQIAQDAP